jgi:hypothetical protein
MTSPTPDKLHDIDLKEGHFGQTSAQDLTDAFNNFQNSKLNHTSCRFEPKDFRRRRPDGKG